MEVTKENATKAMIVGLIGLSIGTYGLCTLIVPLLSKNIIVDWRISIWLVIVLLWAVCAEIMLKNKQ
jgi:hypothetical protein